MKWSHWADTTGDLSLDSKVGTWNMQLQEASGTIQGMRNLMHAARYIVWETWAKVLRALWAKIPQINPRNVER